MEKAKMILRNLLYKNTNVGILFIFLIVMLSALGLILGGKFFSFNNFQSMAFQLSEFGFLALAMALSMLTGGIDLSIVSNAGLAGVLGAYIMSGRVIEITTANHEILIVLGVLVVFTASVLGGFFNGVLIAKLSVAPILATLGSMVFFTGIGMAITNGESIGIRIPEYAALGTSTFLGVPVIFWLLLLAIVVIWVILQYTVIGKSIYLFGENSVSLKFSGVDTEKTIIITYTIIGVLVGCAALIMVSRVNAAKIGFGDTYQLQAILVAVLAGFNPEGGRGKIMGVVLAMASLQFLQNAFTILNFTPYFKKFIWGAMLLSVMIINYFINKEKKFKIKVQSKNEKELIKE